MTSNTTSEKAVKFFFHEAFDEPEAEIDPTAPEAPAGLTNAEVEALRRECTEAGRAQGLEEARAASEATIAGLVETIGQNVARLMADRAALEEQLTREAAQVAHAIAMKLTPRLMKSHPLAEIEQLTDDCMRALGDEPRLVIRLNEAMLEPMKTRVDALAAAAGYEGSVILLGDDQLGPLDCRIEWANGGTERRVAPLIKTVEQTVNRFLDTPRQAATPPETSTQTEDENHG